MFNDPKNKIYEYYSFVYMYSEKDLDKNSAFQFENIKPQGKLLKKMCPKKFTIEHKSIDFDKNLTVQMYLKSKASSTELNKI